MSDGHLIERRISGEQVYRGNFLDVRRDIVALPDGQTATREYIVHPGAVMVLPLLASMRTWVRFLATSAACCFERLNHGIDRYQST